MGGGRRGVLVGRGYGASYALGGGVAGGWADGVDSPRGGTGQSAGVDGGDRGACGGRGHDSGYVLGRVGGDRRGWLDDLSPTPFSLAST